MIDTSEIKRRVDIADLIASYNVPLKPAGRILKACCPFHQEKTPSFVVYPETGTWRCFGACADGGDIFSFVMRYENLSFREALELLAARAGIALDSQAEREAAERARLYALLAAAETFYHETLREHRPQANYLIQDRSILPATIRAWRLGYAPSDRLAVRAHLHAEGFSDDEMVNAGVLGRDDKGRLYDIHLNRILFPIHDGEGRVVGFGGRGTDPKYKNTPQTTLFNKSHVLFGLDHAKEAIRAAHVAFIVEGYMDAVLLWQQGVQSVVASMGTALTPQQAETLMRYTKTIYLCLDADAAGREAVLRAIPKVQSVRGQSLDLRVMTLPDDRDPDELILAAPEVWNATVAAAVPAAQYLVDAYTRDLTPSATLAEREAAARRAVPALLQAATDAVQQDNLAQLAVRVRLDVADLRRMNTAPTPQPALAVEAAPQTALTMTHLFIGAILLTPAILFATQRQLAELKVPPLAPKDIADPELRNIFMVFSEALEQFDEDEQDYLLSRLADRTLYDALRAAAVPDAEKARLLGLRLKLAALQTENRNLVGLIEFADQFAANTKAIATLSQAVGILYNTRKG